MPRRLRFPDPLVLLVACVLLAAIATWILPAGQYERELVGEREVVVAGTYHTVPQQPVGLFETFVALPVGLIEAAEVVFLIFLVGGAFSVVDATGALRGAVSWLAGRLGERDLLMVPILSLVFAAGGVLQNAQEEIIAVMPVLMVLMRRLGFQPLTAAAVSVGPAMVGSAFSPMNPFQVGIAQRIAELPLLSGGGFRSLFLIIALGFWIVSTMRWAARSRIPPVLDETTTDVDLDPRHVAILATVAVTFGILVWGLLGLGWGFNDMSALFFLMAFVVGLLGGLGVQGTARAYGAGFRDMAYAAILVGFARAIFVVLEEGAIVDTVVHALFTPIADLPTTLAALGMMVSQILIHIPVPSVSGQAVLTMPVQVPLADLLGLPRQVAVLAYQMGGGVSDLVVPTNGSLLAILAAGHLRYEDWLRWVLPRYLVLLGLGGISIVIAVAIGLQ